MSHIAVLLGRLITLFGVVVALATTVAGFWVGRRWLGMVDEPALTAKERRQVDRMKAYREREEMRREKEDGKRRKD